MRIEHQRKNFADSSIATKHGTVWKNKQQQQQSILTADLSMQILWRTNFTRPWPCCWIQSEIRMLTSLWSRYQPTFSPLCTSCTATSPNSALTYSVSPSASYAERPFLKLHFNTSPENITLSSFFCFRMGNRRHRYSIWKNGTPNVVILFISNTKTSETQMRRV